MQAAGEKDESAGEANERGGDLGAERKFRRPVGRAEFARRDGSIQPRKVAEASISATHGHAPNRRAALTLAAATSQHRVPLNTRRRRPQNAGGAGHELLLSDRSHGQLIVDLRFFGCGGDDFSDLLLHLRALYGSPDDKPLAFLLHSCLTCGFREIGVTA